MLQRAGSIADLPWWLWLLLALLAGASLAFARWPARLKAPAIASNQSFSGWTDTFTDPRLCAAIVDRLTYHGTIIETGTHSYRLAHARSQHG